jgi:hypothetical protein
MDPMLGADAYLAQVRSLEVQPHGLHSRVRFVRRKHGDVATDELIARMPESSRHYVIERPATDWYPITPILDFDRLLVEGPLKGSLKDIEWLASEQASSDLSGFLKAFLWLAGSPSLVMKRLPAALQRYFRQGELVIVRTGEARTEVELKGTVLPMYMCHYMIPGWATQALRMAGADSPKAVHETCVHAGHPACRWVASWLK